MDNRTNLLIQTILLGLFSAIFYFLLYYFNEPILELSTQGGWYFIIPVSIAFLFSFIHGAFTHYFWNVLGIKTKFIQK
ncbi:MAG: hypothetical protein KAH84_06275 [Thiomargarita sp.]|nr:hypothetical protein [Thiomargarita sp.]